MKGAQYKQIKVLSAEPLEAAPSEIKILPVGSVSSEKGDFLVDQESYQSMKAEMERRGIDIVIDYEHQTLQDVQAPAAGWIKALRYTPEAITAVVEWTQKAAEYLKNREYRYLSPVVLCRKSDGKAVILNSMALTNMPAIHGMFAVVNSIDLDHLETNNLESNKGGDNVELKKLIELLGLAEDATEEQALAALKERLAESGSNKEEEEKKKDEPETELVANSVVLGLLGLAADSKTEDVTSKIMELKAGSSKDMRAIQELRKKMEEKEADEAVIMALKDGKITADQKEWARDYAKKDRAGFDQFMLKAPVVVPVGKLDTQDAKKKPEKTAVDPMILKATGVSKEDIEKYGFMEVE